MYGLYFDSNDKKRIISPSQESGFAFFSGSLQRFDFSKPVSADYSNIIGKTIYHYRVLEKIGEGGMGHVYKAYDLNLQRAVALKILPAHLCKKEDVKNQFIKEARLLSSLEHPYICTIHDIFEGEDGALYMVITCYEGKTLRKHIAEGRFKWERAVHVVKQIASALLKTHEKGIIHQDVKPENVIITTAGMVKIIDFGVAQLIGQSSNSKNKTSMGTITYMSPEQTSHRPVDHRTDIWSLGVVFYELLSGSPPFNEEFEEALVYSILNEQVPGMRHVPKALNKIVKKCLEKDPSARFQQMRDLLTDLEVYLTRGRFSKSLLKRNWFGLV